MRHDLPSGTVTFLFTDVEGSTRLLHELGAERYAEALAEHRRAIREACSAESGVEVDTQGDAFFFAFPTAPGALASARALTEALAAGPIRVRVGLHTGTPVLTTEGYVGEDVHRAARIAAAGNGGQVLVSAATAALVDDRLLRDLGEHRLRDLSAPERISQLGDLEFAPLRTLYRTNLPVPANSFLGRKRELSDVVELLGDARIVTLVGPGGAGKTRLALHAAAEASDDFPDGVWWIPLAPVRSPELVVSVLAQTLDLGEKPGLKLEDTLASELTGRRALLVLDNLEHLLPDAVRTVALLRDTRGPRVLATSRERLRIRGEQSYPVPPLTSQDGVALFVARTRAVDPEFTRTPEVDELCARLDELPLAIELAAARTALFTPAQLLERVSERLDLLTGDRDTDPRQQTLRATIDWSFDLLADEEQQLFRRLGVFVGGCTYEAAQEVCGATPDTLQSLIDKSLLRRRDDDAKARRYWMLETIREYARERLEEAGETSSLRERHAAHYASTAADWVGPVHEDPRDPRRTSVVERERANIHAAAEWSLAENGASVEQAGLATAWHLLSIVDGVAGRFSDAVSEAERVIAHARLGGALALQRTSAMNIGAAVVLGPTPVDDGIAKCERTLELIRGDAISEGTLLSHLASLWALKGDFDRAHELLGQGRVLAAEVEEEVATWGADLAAKAALVRADASVEAWRVLTLEGDLDAAERELREANEQLLRGGERELRSTVCGLLGQTLYALGRYDEIDQFLQLAEGLAHEDDYDTQALWHATRAKMLARQGSFEEAERRAHEAVEILTGTDVLLLQFDSLLGLAEVQRLAGSDAIGDTLAEAHKLAEAKGSPVLARRVVDLRAAVDAAT